MGDVDLNIHLMMGDQANATQLLIQTRRALAVPQVAGAVTVMLTANVMDVLTSAPQVIKSFYNFLEGDSIKYADNGDEGGGRSSKISKVLWIYRGFDSNKD